MSKHFFKLPGTGASIPFPGFGVGTKWQHLKKGRPDHIKHTLDENLADTVANALKLGFTHIDTAQVYTTHDEVAEGIKRSGIDRSKIWITDKYNPGFYFPSANIDQDQDLTAYESIEIALKELNTDYIDLYLIHSQFAKPGVIDFAKVWKDLERAYEEGKVKNIGLSNFDIEHIESIFKIAKIKPQVLQLEFHPYLYNQSPGIIEFAKKNNLLIEAYGPLTPLFRAPEGSPLPPVLKELSTKYSKTEAQILLRWVYQNGILPLTTSANSERITQALEAFSDDWELSQEDVELITKTGSTFHHQGFFTGFFDKSS